MATKVMYLLDRYEGPQAGTEGQLLQLLEHLDRTRFEPAMAVLRTSEYIEHHTLPCAVQTLGITRLLSSRSIIKLTRFAAGLRREGFRLVHCFFNDVSIIAPPLLRMFGLRVIVSRRDMGFWYRPWNLALLRIVAPFVDRYVTNSQAVKRIVEDREWIPSWKATVIYNGYLPTPTTNTDANKAPCIAPLPGHGPIVGMVANLRPIKRIDQLIKAFALVRRQHRDARLVVVGGDSLNENGVSMKKELDALADSLGIRDWIDFPGSSKDPAAFIRQFSVAVLCSESEGFSNSLIEYMQLGRPVVCTNTGGNPELIEDGVNGFLVPVGDVATLADRIGRLLGDPITADRFGEAARETVRSSYSHVRMVTEQMACYDAVVSGRRFEPEHEGNAGVERQH